MTAAEFRTAHKGDTQMTDLTTEKLPVYLCAAGEHVSDPDKFRIGMARDKKEAAKRVRQETGDSEYTAQDVTYSGTYNAYFAE